MLLTQRFGKVRAVAKGVRRTNSKFGSRLEPMSHVEVLLRKGRDLDLVSQAESVDGLTPMLSSLDRAAQGMAVVEAADQLSLEGEPDERLYMMLVGVLRTIGESPSPLNVAAFFWKVLAMSGLSPVLDGCVRCGEADGGETALVAFDLNEGGALCRRCRSGTSISPAALDIMRDILGGRLRQALRWKSLRRQVRSLRWQLGHLSITLNVDLERCQSSNVIEPLGIDVRSLLGMPATDLDQIVNLCKRAVLFTRRQRSTADFGRPTTTARSGRCCCEM